MMGLLLLILLAACRSAAEPTRSAAPTYDSAPASTSSAGTAAPTPAAPIATAKPTEPASGAAATAPASPQPGNIAGFRDQLAVADQFFVTLSGVPAPPAGQAYQGWLLADDGASISAGVLTLSPDGAATLVWNSPTGENLLGRYARFQITLEPAGGSASPTGRMIFAGGLEGATLTDARRLLVRNEGEPATPLNAAYALGLVAQTGVAVQHVNNAVNAAAIGARNEMRAHLEHAINILQGAGRTGYGDHDGNGAAENPGDGFGVIGYAEQTAALLADQAGGAEVVAGLRAQSAAIQEKCLAIIALNDVTAAAAQLSEVKALIEQFRADWVTRLYQAAQDSVRFPILPAE